MRAVSTLVVLAACTAEHPPPKGHQFSLFDVGTATVVSATDPDALVVTTTLDSSANIDYGPLPPGLDVLVSARGTTTHATSADGSHFQLTIPGPSVPDEAVDVIVTYGDETQISEVRVPGPFTIDSKTGDPAAPPFTVTWSPSGTPYSLEWNATAAAGCAVNAPPAPHFAEDTGTLTIDEPITVVGDGCALSLVLQRENGGAWWGDVGAGGASIVAMQLRQIWP